VAQRRVAAFVFEHKGRFLVRQRPGDTVNGHLWEFPNAELVSEDYNVRNAAKKEFQVALVLEPFCTLKHSITRFRITLDVYRVATPNGSMPPTPAGSRWFTRAALDRLPFTSAHRKIVLRLEVRAPFPART
jgi:A/G-specific adenine glycosylase